MNKSVKALLLCLWGSAVLWAAGVMFFIGREAVAVIFLTVYGGLVYVNGFFTLLEERKKQRESLRSTICTLFFGGHRAELALRSESGEIFALVCDRCKDIVPYGKSSDRKMEV